eukprot:CAMPEP_0202902818 /NCGR_PEP_ID=MMETSP1392-20130828/17063_1 /ASSEMBLY_ACC=CAM_ASM_000868 /TAXON_ID=225041 /ORGANISM="Chlamydomonas chlamydogama, Strain SAG 11-48b" /LENGTH=469 /DNA_ID=CAMNT_0049589625 /DNA_START=342 /DNA_END=1751 /DNA_ORIENTATION=+
MSALAEDKHARTLWLVRQGTDVFNTLAQSITKPMPWTETEVLTSVRVVNSLVSESRAGPDLVIACASLGYTKVLKVLPDVVCLESAALDAAAAAGHVDTIEYLLSAGADPMARGGAPILAAIQAGKEHALKTLLAASPKKWTPYFEENVLTAATSNASCLALVLQRCVQGPSAAKDGALLHAARRGARAAVLMLIKAQADVHAMQDEALCEAQDPEVIKALLEAGADVHAQHEFPLLAASMHGHEDVVELLLDHGADLHALDDAALVRACCGGHSSTVNLLLSRGAKSQAQQGLPLIRAASKGHEDVVDMLLEHGANVHDQYDSALVAASHGGHGEVVRKLLDAGSDVNAEESGALCAAVSRGHSGIVDLLLERGADVSAVADDVEALCHAVEGNHVEVLRLLIDAGLDVHQCGCAGALLLAAIAHGARGTADLLIRAGVHLSETETADHPERVDVVNAFMAQAVAVQC